MAIRRTSKGGASKLRTGNGVRAPLTAPQLLFIVALATACDAGRSPEEYAFRAPSDLGDGIPVATPTQVGVDQSQLDHHVRSILAGLWGRQTSFLVMKDGRLIFEEYFRGWQPDELHEIESVSKSLTSLMIGRAVADGHIGSVNDPVSHYLPRYRHLLQGAKADITVRDFLTMTSGIEWDERTAPYGHRKNSRTQSKRSSDVVEFVLSRPLAHRPGTVFEYNGGGIAVLGEVLVNATGLSDSALVQYAFDRLIAPHEISWEYERNGRLATPGGFLLTPRALLKVGAAVMSGGKWRGQQVFDSQWLEASLQPGPLWPGYGYAWWLGRFVTDDAVHSLVIGSGFGGQWLVVVPDLDLVVVMTADNGRRSPPLFDMLRVILPAVTGTPVRDWEWGRGPEFDHRARQRSRPDPT